MFLFLQLTSGVIIVFNYPHQLVGIFWRDLCDGFSIGEFIDFILDAGMLLDLRRSSHGA
jgi:hypothetical protein